MPWLNSAYPKPISRISRSMTRPSTCRCEFQHVDNEYINKKAERAIHTTLGFVKLKIVLQVGVTSAEHRREPGDLHLAAAAFAGLLVVAMISDFLQCAFAINPLFQPSQGLLH